MSHEVHWTERVYSEFIIKGKLLPLDVKILTTRIEGWTVKRQSIEFNCSERKIARHIRWMKDRYDVVQKEYPDIFPIRKNSDAEKFTDEN